MDWNQWDSNDPPERSLPCGVVCVQLRITDQTVRDYLDVERNKPPKDDNRIDKLLGDKNLCPPASSKEDLLGMQLMFSFVVFEVLDLYGITLERRRAGGLPPPVGPRGELPCHRVGSGDARPESEVQHSVGLARSATTFHPPISSPRSNRSASANGSTPLCEANVAAWSWTALRSGHVLVGGLLDELEEGMPPLLKPLPIAVILPALNNDLVRRRLNLGGNGVLLQSLACRCRNDRQRSPSSRPSVRRTGLLVKCRARWRTTRRPAEGFTSIRRSTSRFLAAPTGLTRPDPRMAARRKNHRALSLLSSVRHKAISSGSLSAVARTSSWVH